MAVHTCTRYRRDSVTCYVRASTTTRAAPYSATVHRCRETDRPVCTYTFMTTLRTLRPGGSQLSGRKNFFRKIQSPFRWVPGGGIIILQVIGGTSLLQPWTNLSASPRTVLFQ